MSEQATGGESSQPANTGSEAAPANTESQGTESVAPETKYVDLDHTTSDKDLEAYLDRAAEFEPDEDGVFSDDEPGKVADSATPIETDKKGGEPVTETPPANRPASEDYNKLVGEFKQQEANLRTKTSEWTDLRKELKEAKAKKQEGLQDLFQENPEQAYEVKKDIEKIDQTLESIDAEEERLTNGYIGQGLLLKHLAPGEHSIDNVVAMLKEDGMPDDFIAKFKANQHEIARPETLLHMHKRAYVERILKKMIPASKKLLEENIALRKKLGEKPTSQPSKAVKQIQKNLSATPAMAAGTPSGAAARQADVLSVDPSKMSDKELDEYLANSKD